MRKKRGFSVHQVAPRTDLCSNGPNGKEVDQTPKTCRKTILGQGIQNEEPFGTLDRAQ